MMSAIKGAACLLEEHTSKILHVLGVFSAIGLIAMMMITVVDATARRFFSFTIYGGYEAVSFLLSGVFFFSLCYCTSKNAHFAIDVVTSRFSPRFRLYTITVVSLVSTLMCWLLSSQLVVLAMKLKGNNLTGAQLTFVPIYILALIGAFCLLMTGWGFFVKFIGLLVKSIEGNDST
jgi:TRAP-type mannitol/chloroaromatic compound transport system permease small subunit